MTSSTTVRAMQYGQHAITVVLLAIGAFRAITGGASPLLVGAVGICFAGWYAAAPVIARRSDGRRLAEIWLIGLALLWLALDVVSAEFIWLAFPLWLLAGHLLTPATSDRLQCSHLRRRGR